MGLIKFSYIVNGINLCTFDFFLEEMKHKGAYLTPVQNICHLSPTDQNHFLSLALTNSDLAFSSRKLDC